MGNNEGVMSKKYSHETIAFFERVYSVVQQVPAGRVTTYGAIAAHLGSPRSSRMVGWAMNASHRRYEVPAHRVVNRVGLLTGAAQFDTPTLMQELLESEGITVKNNQVVNFSQLFWDPNKYLS